MFLQPLPEALELVCDCSVCLGDLIFEGLAPAEGNQGGDDYEFSQ